MKNIIRTTNLEFEKSGFIIDLVEHSSGLLYIEIIQRIENEEIEKRTIKINPRALPSLLTILQSYQNIIPDSSNFTKYKLGKEDTQEISKSYLKGVSIKDLSLLYNVGDDIIEIILRNNGLAIVDNKLPKSMIWKKYKKKRRD